MASAREQSQSKPERKSRAERYRESYRETYDPKNYRENYRKNYRDNPIYTDSYDSDWYDSNFGDSKRLYDFRDFSGLRVPEPDVDYFPVINRPNDAPPSRDLDSDQIRPARESAGRSPSRRAIPLLPAVEPLTEPLRVQFPSFWLQANRYRQIQQARSQPGEPESSAGDVAAGTSTVQTDLEPPRDDERTGLEQALDAFENRRYFFALQKLKEEYAESPQDAMIAYSYAVALFASGLLEESADRMQEALQEMESHSITPPDLLSFYGKPVDAEVHLRRLERQVERTPSDEDLVALQAHLTGEPTPDIPGVN